MKPRKSPVIWDVPSEPEKETIHEQKTETEYEPIQEDLSVPVVESEYAGEKETITMPQKETIPEVKPSFMVEIQTEFDEVQKLKAARQKPILRVEDERKRQTYLLSKADIKAIKTMSEATGYDKYEIVSMAVQHFYNHFQEK